MPKAASAIKPFSFRLVSLTNDNILYIIDVQALTPILKQFID
jgi:hypothetical protein